jgi:hypothetical protein
MRIATAYAGKMNDLFAIAKRLHLYGLSAPVRITVHWFGNRDNPWPAFVTCRPQRVESGHRLGQCRAMNLSDFCAACEWLAGEGIEICEASYHGRSFGNWFIEVSHNGKLRRAVWDGRDRWLIIQSQHDTNDWQDEWIARKDSEQTVEEVVTRLRKGS